jgi:two-component system response regulator AlgR
MNDQSKISVISEHDTLLIPHVDIIYFMADKKYINVVTEQHRYRIENSLDRLSNVLSSDFVRAHRKYLVRTSVIRSIIDIDGSKFLDVSGTPDPIPISRRELPHVRKLLKMRVLQWAVDTESCLTKPSRPTPTTKSSTALASTILYCTK